MVICSAEQSHEWVGQLPHADPSGSSFLQSSCHGEGDGWALHRQRAIAKNMCIPRDTVEKPCVSLGIRFLASKSVSSIGIQNVC